jgi:hypothetical protein
MNTDFAGRRTSVFMDPDFRQDDGCWAIELGFERVAPRPSTLDPSSRT